MRTARIAPGGSVGVDLRYRPGLFIGRSQPSTYVNTWLNWRSGNWHTLFPWSYSWLADDLAAGSIATWTGGVGGLSFTQGTSGAQPVQAATSGPNSQPGVTFDATDDYMQIASGSSLIVAQPDTVVIIGRYVSAGSAAVTRRLFDSANTAARQTLALDTTGNYIGFAGTLQTDSAANTSAHAHVAYFNGASSVIEIDNSAIISADLGAQSLDGMTLAARFDGAATFGNVVISAIGIYSGDARAHNLWDTVLAPYVLAKWAATL